jgi:hypothetical protein
LVFFESSAEIGYNVKVDAKYGNYIKLGIAALTAFGLLGTGAQTPIFSFYVPTAILL